MGTYKVFNGTDWVNICDCQVHVRNASNDWQLLDPANCVTKYWTGTEWCEIICTPIDPCSCSTGEVVIGTQTWTCRNLDVETYRNGDVIPQVQDPAQWATITTGAWCYHENNSVNGPIYGKLYNWYAVNDPRGLAPVGWKIPTESEWYTLRTYLGGESALNAKAKEVGTQHWLSPNSDATNEVCFTALGGSQRGYTGIFDIIKRQAYFWTSTEYPSDTSKAWYRVLNYDPTGIYGLGYVSKRSGMSIRLLKEDIPPAGCTGTEVVIGTQTWTRTNLDVATYRDNTVIPQVTDPTQWENLTTGAWCYYNNDPSTEATYGKLYNWFAVNDSRGLAPNGYHIPSQTEWITLQTYLGGDTVAGGKMKEVGTSHWNSPNVATNDSCFTSLPGGNRDVDGSFDGIQYYAHYWTSTANSGSIAPTAHGAQLVNDSSILNMSTAFAARGYSVRLIKD
jgi:uncharacterized protein (TIGR02145 family)